MVRECKTLPFFSAGCPYRRRFRSFVRLQERLFGVSLPFPRLAGADDEARLKDFKSFCGGLLESPVNHLWHGSIHRLSRSSRMSVAMSLFLFRKVLPSPKPSISDYIEKMSEESPLPDGSFLRFCQVQVRKMFPDGWDLVSYPSAALGRVLPMSSCRQNGRSKGGCRGIMESASGGWNDHQTYVLRVLSEQHFAPLMPSKVTLVETAGKYRVVSVPDIEMNILGPLHSAIYNHISRFPWLLRGEATANAFRLFTARKGEVFVSGDYESATDNLNMWVQKVILAAILRGTVSVPDHVKRLAVDSQSLVLQEMDDRGEVVRAAVQRRGQMMGNLLSFPLLCIVNYLGFRFFGGANDTKDLPVKINGDDIVFRGPPQVYHRWKRGVVGAGLTLSEGKTMVDGRYFSLNSTMFCAGGSRVRLVPCIRSSAFGLKGLDDPVQSLAGRWRRVCRDFPCGFRRRLAVEAEFLRVNQSAIVKSNSSVTRGLGMKFHYESLVEANLWAREAWYLSFPREQPLPRSPSAREQLGIPKGFEAVRVEKITKEMRDVQSQVRAAFISQAWEGGCGAETTDAEKRAYREALALRPSCKVLGRGARSPRVALGSVEVRREVFGSPYLVRTGVLGYRSLADHRSKLLGLSPRNLARYLSPRVLGGGGEGGFFRTGRRILRENWLRGKSVVLPAGFLKPAFLARHEDGAVSHWGV